MKFTAQEEYGLRCALQVARQAERQAEEIITIPEIAGREGLTTAYVAKLMRLLLKGGIVTSTRGHQGGYRLSHPAAQVSVADVMDALGGGLFPDGFCTDHRGDQRACVHSADCALRSVFTSLDAIVRASLERITLSDLLVPECRAAQLIPLRLDAPEGGGTSPRPA